MINYFCENIKELKAMLKEQGVYDDHKARIDMVKMKKSTSKTYWFVYGNRQSYEYNFFDPEDIPDYEDVFNSLIHFGTKKPFKDIYPEFFI